GGFVQIAEHQDVMSGTSDTNPGQLPATRMRRSFLSEQQRAAVRIIKDDRRIEFLALRFVDGHDVDASQVISTRQELIFSDGGIESTARIPILALCLPEIGQRCGNAASTLKGGKLLGVFRYDLKRVGACIP